MSGGHEPKMNGTKRCPKCGEEKPALAFYVNRRMSEGLSSWCRQCHREGSSRTPSARRLREKSAEKKVRLAKMARPPV